jgi:hypothetical protein
MSTLHVVAAFYVYFALFLYAVACHGVGVIMTPFPNRPPYEQQHEPWPATAR